jgi:SAM-dependent methyltransferase
MSQDPVELTRGLLDETAVLRHGFLDVLGESTSSPVPTVAQRAMNSPFVATVYERLWRPAAFYMASGVTHRAEQHRAASALHLSTAQRLVDVACGPGNFTGPLAEQLPDGGLAVGFDISVPMLAVRCRRKAGLRRPLAISRLGSRLTDAEDPDHRCARFRLHDPRFAPVDGLRRELEHHRLAGPLGHLGAFDLE